MAFIFKEIKHMLTYKLQNSPIQSFFPNTYQKNVSTLLKEAEKWDVPNKFAKPVGFKVVDASLPKYFKKLDKSFADILFEDLQSLCTVNAKKLNHTKVTKRRNKKRTKKIKRHISQRRKKKVMKMM